MRRYLRTSDLVREYMKFDADRREQYFNSKREEMGAEIHTYSFHQDSWYEIEYLDSVLDIIFTYNTDVIDIRTNNPDARYHHKQITFSIIGGKMTIINIVGWTWKQFADLFIPDIKDVLSFYIPNYKTYFDVVKVYPELSRQDLLMNSHITAKVLLLLKGKTDLIGWTYRKFERYLHVLIKGYFKQLYSDIKIPYDAFKLLKDDGWTLMGLDEMDELIELYLLDETNSHNNCLYFRKGYMCLALNNDTLVNVRNSKIAGNLREVIENWSMDGS